VTIKKDSAPSKQTLSSATRLRGGFSGSPVVFNNAPLWQSAQAFVGVNAVGFLISAVAPSCHYHVDLLGSGSFAVAALPALNSSNSRIATSAACMAAWGAKLAGFLFFRVIKNGHDSRLSDLLATPRSAFSFWVVSMLWGVICSLPHTLGTTSSLPGNAVTTTVGKVLFGLGFVTEALADFQKWRFKASHPGQFCSAGLWSISQHPNWFGNLLLWTGIVIMNAPALVGKKSGLLKYTRLGLACLSPAFMWVLFNGQATGTIAPGALAGAHARYGYGSNAEYTKYVDNVSLIIPGL